MFAHPQQVAQQALPQPAFVDTRAFGLVLPGYPVVFDTAFQRVAADRWVLPIEFAQVSSRQCSHRFAAVTRGISESSRRDPVFKLSAAGCISFVKYILRSAAVFRLSIYR